MAINQYDDELAQLGSRPANPYRDTVAELKREEEERLRTTVAQAPTASPDAAAETERLSQATGLPTSVVGRNLEDIRKRARVATTPYAAMLKETPVLASWLTEQPTNAAVAKDDLEQLGALEWLLTAPTRAFHQGQAQVEFGRLRSQSIFRDLTADEHARLEELRGQMTQGGALGARNSWFRGAVTGTASQIPNLYGAFLAGFPKASAAAVTAGSAAALAGQMGPQVALPEELVTVPTMFGGGFTAGMLAGGAEFSAQIEAGNAYDEYLQFRDEVGRPLDPSVAKAAALATGAVNGGLEIFGLEKLAHSIPGLNRLPGLFTRDAMKAALRSPTVRAALADAVKTYGGTLTAEVAVELAQRAVTILAGELAKTAPAGDVPGQLEPGNVNLYAQPRVPNADGTTSTVDSLSINIDGHEVLLPTVTPDGQHFAGTDDERTQQALEEYRRTGRNLGTFDSPEAATAFAQQLHNDYAAGVYDSPGRSFGLLPDRFRTAGAIGADLANEGLGALQSFALMVLPGPALSVATASYRARQAQQNVAFFTALGEGVANSKTAQRLPDKFQDVLARVTKDGPIETVYAPLETWTSYWQSKGLDPGEVAAKVTGDAQAFERAQQTGEDLAIPTARYASALAGTDHNKFFAQELRLQPQEMNAREAAAFIEQQAAAVDKRNPDSVSGESTAAPVRDAMIAQLENAGVERSVAEAYATGLYAHPFDTLQQRLGVNAGELFGSRPIEVSREGLPASIDTAAAGGEIPASSAPAGETSAQRTARTMAHTAALVSVVTRDARRQDPTVDPETIRRELEWRLSAYEEGQQAVATESGRDPVDLLKAIASYGGLWSEKGGESKGEIAQFMEGRDIRGVKAGTGRVVHKRGAATWAGVAGVFKKTGLTPDGMVEALRQDQRFAHITDINELFAAIEHALGANTAATDANRLPGTAELGELGITLGTPWWDKGGRSDLADSADVGGDVSFDVTEFNQAARPKLYGPLRQPLAPPNKRGESSYFIGWQLGVEELPAIPLYNVVGGERDKSTLSPTDLDREGIPYLEAPSLEAPAGQPRAGVTEFNQSPAPASAPLSARRTYLEDRIARARADGGEDLEAQRRLQDVQDQEAVAVASTIRDVAQRGTVGADGAYQQDLFGESIGPENTERAANRTAREGGTGDVSAAGTVRQRADTAGTFATQTQLVTETTRQLGADKVLTVEDAAAAAAYLAAGAQERFDGIVVDAAGTPLAVVGSFKGGVNEAHIQPSVVVAEAFRIEGAAAIWFAHNHPSGDAGLSKEDRNVAARFAEIFRGTEIEMKGLLAVGSSGEGKFGFDFYDPTSKTSRSGTVEAVANGPTVPVVERHFTSTGKLAARFTGPETAMPTVAKLSRGKFGVVITDTKYAPIGFLPMDPADAGELRQGGRLDALYRALSVSGGAGAIIHVPDPAMLPAAMNVANALHSVDLQVLDIFTRTAGTYSSESSVGKIPLTGQFTQDNRGVIRFGSDRKFQIELLRHADLSTFIHETGHYYLELLGDLSEQVGAADPATLTDEQRKFLADYGTILQWLGVENRSDLGVDQHEQYARAFEAYLFEGKAPSVELRNVFARFRAWLVGVYRSIAGLNVQLSDEVRGVFDRLFATDEAIAAAQEEARITPLFIDAAAAGMTELEFASYQDQVRQASERAREELQARVLADLKREEYSWWKQERDAIRADVERDLAAQPVYRALSVMRTGALADGTPLLEGQPAVPMKLSRDSIVAQFGRDVLRRLPRPYIYAADSGIAADTAAEIFGFSSGDELIKAILEARPFRQAVDLETDARMFAKHGDVMRDGRLEELARAAVEGEHRQKVVQAELKALTKGMVAATIPSADVINAAAARRIASTRIREIRPGQFLMAARRAGQQAFNLLASGQDRAGAVRAKLQESLNLALYRAARDARENVESMRSTLQAFSSPRARSRFGKAGPEYLEQIDNFLERYELARVPATEVARRQSLRQWAEARQAEGLPVEISGDLLDDARRVNYQDITLEEFTGVFEAVEQIAHLARLKNELLKAERRRTFEEARDTLVGSIRLNNDARKLPLEFRSGDERWHRIGDWFASHTKIATIARALDGHVDGGEMWEQIIRPLNAAADIEQARFEDAGAAVREILERAYPGRELAELNRKTFIAAIGDSLSKEGRLAVALNWGNEQNRARLLADPTRGWNEAQIQAILETLDARDWRFVQDVWDYINTFWPDIEAKQRRVTGLAPAKVEAAAFTVTPNDAQEAINVSGGYYPLVYDGRLVARAGVLQRTGEAGLAQQAAYVHATTRRGHTEARADKVKLSVRLELGVIGQHLQNVIHDLTHHEALIDVNRLVSDSDVQQAIVETKGDQAYRQVVNALDDIAKGGSAGAGTPTVLDSAANWMRTRTQLAMMGWNLWTALQQPLGVFNGMERVGPVWVLRGLKRWLRDAATMENTARWIYEVSPFMNSRGSTATQDLADVRRELSKPGGWFDNLLRTVSFDTVGKQEFLESYLWHIGQAQKVADIPTWLGAYEKAMADPAAYGDEKRAIALADQAVRDSQGSGQIVDLAQVQRGSPIAKLLLTFYSYGNTVYNRTAANVDMLRRGGPTWLFLGHLGLLYAMPAVMTVMLSRAIGRSRDDDSWLAEFAKELLASALNTMALAREFANLPGPLLLSEGVRGYAGPAGLRAIQAVYDFSAQARQGELDRALARSATTLGGILFGFPAAQTQRSVDGFIALREGRTRNPLALLFGAPPKKAAR